MPFWTQFSHVFPQSLREQFSLNNSQLASPVVAKGNSQCDGAFLLPWYYAECWWRRLRWQWRVWFPFVHAHGTKRSAQADGSFKTLRGGWEDAISGTVMALSEKTIRHVSRTQCDWARMPGPKTVFERILNPWTILLQLQRHLNILNRCWHATLRPPFKPFAGRNSAFIVRCMVRGCQQLATQVAKVGFTFASNRHEKSLSRSMSQITTK